MIPSDLASFVACHEARDHVGADNDPQDHLIGKYGSPNGQVQATAGMRPLLKLVGTGGYQCLRFDDVDDLLILDPATSLAGPYTVFHVYAGLGNSGTHYPLHGEPAFNGGWGNGWRFAWSVSGGNSFYQANAYPGGGNEINLFDYQQDEIRVHMATMGTPFTVGFKYYVDNAIVGAASDATGPGTLQLGALGSGAHMDWIATITFNAILSPTEQNGIFNYVVQDILGGGMQRYAQANLEAVMTAVSNLRFGQSCIEYVRSVATAGQRFWGQVVQ